MIALISTELRRDWSRRAVHLFGLLAFAGIALGAVLVFLNSTKPGNGFSVIDIRDVFKGVSAPLTILGIASLSRNTTAAVLGAFFYLFVLENIIDALKPQYSGWLFTQNAGIFIDGPKAVSEAASNGEILGHSSLQALLVLCSYAAIVTVVAVALFVRRDVT
jgi:hypothetical protein